MLSLYASRQPTCMNNFDAKFGPRPVCESTGVLVGQFVIVLITAIMAHPPFLNEPGTTRSSPALLTLFSLMSVLASVALHRSFSTRF